MSVRAVRAVGRPRGSSGAVMCSPVRLRRPRLGFRPLVCCRGPEATPCAGPGGHGGLSGARRPAAGLRSTARRTEPALLWIRHRRMRTRMVVERSVRAVWTGATRAGARPFMKLAGLRPGRGAERGAGSRRPEPAG